MAEKQIKKAPEKPDKVVLKPFFGISPGLYLTIAYGLTAAVFLTAVILAPGIVRYGSLVSFGSVPDGAAVYADGRYIGSGDFVLFMPAGEYLVRFEKPGFETESQQVRIGGRRFFSLFLPRRASVEVKLSLNSLDQYLSWRLQSIYNWSLVTEYSSNYRYPALFAATGRDIAAAELSDDQLSRTAQWYREAAALISSSDMLDDYLAGAEFAAASFGPLQHTDPDSLEFLKSHFSERLTAAEVQARIDSAAGDDGFSADPDRTRYDTESVVTIWGIPFIYLEGGTAVSGNRLFTPGLPPDQLPAAAKVDSLYVAMREVSERDFARFVEDVPFWHPEMRAALISAGLADEFYLQGIDIDDPTDFPIRSVSWYAAEAFLEWLSLEVNRTLPGFRAVFPDGFEWQYAASASEPVSALSSLLSAAPSYLKYPVNFLGNVWEFTRDPYLFSGKIFDSGKTLGLSGIDTEKVVRGGSRLNGNNHSFLYVNGSLDPSACSEFVGFRPFLTRQGEN